MTDEEQMNAYIEQALKLFEERSEKPCVYFSLTDSEPDIFSCKVGGTPYLPHGEYPPRDSKSGAEMRLLCQMDCTAFARMPDYPHEGMLQIWFAPLQDSYDVTYHPHIDRTVTEAEVRAKITPMTDEEKDEFFVVNGGYGMNLHPGRDTMSTADDRCGSLLYQCLMEVSGGTFVDRFSDDLPALFEDMISQGDGHKFGGYHYDPQTWFTGDYNQNWKSDLGSDSEELLLFQLEYEHGYGKDWREGAKVILGDCGVIQFFITRKDLKALNFAVSYNFSCS